MTSSPSKPSTAQNLSLLVTPDVRKALNWRKVLNGDFGECGTEALMVQVGPPAPYRLLVLHSGEDGLITVQLWEVKKKTSVIFDRKVMSDLVPFTLQKVAAEHKLGS